eukprot:8980961-Pyramimonas_sp.AAC.1
MRAPSTIINYGFTLQGGCTDGVLQVKRSGLSVPPAIPGAIRHGCWCIAYFGAACASVASTEDAPDVAWGTAQPSVRRCAFASGVRRIVVAHGASDDSAAAAAVPLG